MNKKNHKHAHCRLVLQHDKITKLTICECVVYYHSISTDFIKKKLLLREAKSWQPLQKLPTFYAV